MTDRTDGDEDGDGDGDGDGTHGRRGPDGVGGLHHVGVATDDLAARTGLYGDLLGLPVAHEETFDGLAVAFLGTGPYVELLEPLTDDGPIARHLDRRGPGLHHLACAVGDVSVALERARRQDVDPIDEEPRAGAWGHRVAFLHPGATGGVLLELVGEERAGDGRGDGTGRT